MTNQESFNSSDPIEAAEGTIRNLQAELAALRDGNVELERVVERVSRTEQLRLEADRIRRDIEFESRRRAALERATGSFNQPQLETVPAPLVSPPPVPPVLEVDEEPEPADEIEGE